MNVKNEFPALEPWHLIDEQVMPALKRALMVAPTKDIRTYLLGAWIIHHVSGRDYVQTIAC